MCLSKLFLFNIIQSFSGHSVYTNATDSSFISSLKVELTIGCELNAKKCRADSTTKNGQNDIIRIYNFSEYNSADLQRCVFSDLDNF